MKRKTTIETEITLSKAESARAANGWPCPKWITFCRHFLKQGWQVKTYYSKSTVSKYVYLQKTKPPIALKVRFSNHKPAKSQQQKQDADFYVGISHGQVLTTEQVIVAIERLYKQ